MDIGPDYIDPDDLTIDDVVSKDSVHIIESPSRDDISINRIEGKALEEVLRLAEIEVTYKLVKGEAGFKRAVKRLATRIRQSDSSTNLQPYIHISAHGSSYGVKFTDRSFLNWSKFRLLLEEVENEIGRANITPSRHLMSSRLVLCFSTCEGYNAYKIHADNANTQDSCPFQCVVGPTEEVDWVDSLLAFQVFYHAANYRYCTFDEAVSRMNIATGLNNIFQLYKSPELH